MITRSQHNHALDWSWNALNNCGLKFRDVERAQIEVADFGLSRLEQIGAQILTLESTPWVSVKILVMMPWQLEPQHRHPPSLDGNYPGKTEVLRCQWGELLHYDGGAPPLSPRARPTPQDAVYLNVWRETILSPGHQLTLAPDTWHWFQAGPQGAVVWTISSKVTDNADQWVDPRIVRQTVIQEAS